MGNRLPFTYGEFYDVPRMLVFQLDDQWYLMRSFFDEDSDDYSSVYDVYLLPFRSEDELKSHSEYWRHVSQYEHLGQIAVSSIGLDNTRRSNMDEEVIRNWLSSRA